MKTQKVIVRDYKPVKRKPQVVSVMVSKVERLVEPAPKPKHNPGPKKELNELQKLLRKLRELPKEQRDELATVTQFQRRIARLQQDLSDEIERLRQQQ